MNDIVVIDDLIQQAIRSLTPSVVAVPPSLQMGNLTATSRRHCYTPTDFAPIVRQLVVALQKPLHFSMECYFIPPLTGSHLFPELLGFHLLDIISSSSSAAAIVSSIDANQPLRSRIVFKSACPSWAALTATFMMEPAKSLRSSISNCETTVDTSPGLGSILSCALNSSSCK